LKPAEAVWFQNSGGEIINRDAEADRLEAGGLSPIGGKSTATRSSLLPVSWTAN
jgi:hypothetical protein